ncbi:MAG: radical SAM protein [bacterium]
MDRAAGRRGWCGAGDAVEVFRYGPHFGEEPPLSGTRGSGTIFFSRCTLRCLYCQNHPWSQEGAGACCDADGLDDIFRQLADLGCHNWNLVSPTPWLPWIWASLDRLAVMGVRRPVVYNTSGYECQATLQGCVGRVAVYLTDLRYAEAASASAASEADDYVDMARAALLEMVRQTGPLALDADGLAVRGTIARVLILPGRAAEAVASLRWLRANAPDAVASVMAQYMPAHRAAACGAPWNRGVTQAEYDMVAEAVADLDFESGWMQEFGGAPPADDLVGFRMPPGAAAVGQKVDVGKLQANG